MLQTLQALAEPNRFRIVELLRLGARPVGDIGEALDIRQPQVSKHLSVLKAAGLVGVEAQAQQRVYGLRAAPLRELNAWTERYRQLWEERFTQMDALLEELKSQSKNQTKPPHHPRTHRARPKRKIRE